MSHFVVYVFTKEEGRSVESLLSPFNEDITYAPYVEYTKEQAIAKVRKEIEEYRTVGLYAEYLKNPEQYIKEHCNCKEHIKYITEEFPQKLTWTDEQCYEDEKKWFDDDMVDESGNLLSTYNPNSKWDYYVIGGRWDGALINKEGKTTNEDYVSEIDFSKTMVPFAFVDPIGRWFEKGKMGWWGMVSNEKDTDSWENAYKEFVKKLDKNITVTVIDCHI